MGRGPVVNLDRGRLRVHLTVTEVTGFGAVEQDDGKTDATERPMALDPTTVAMLRRWRTDQAAPGLPRVGVHGLRPTYATVALRAAVSPEVVSKRLGHSSVVVSLSIYAHVFEQDDQAAAEQVAAAIWGGTGS